MMKKIIVFGFLAVLALILLFAFWSINFSGNGTAPESPKDAQTTSPGGPPDEFSNGQKYKVFSGNGFEVRYPDWPNIDQKAVPNPENIKIAVTDRGCVFMAKIADIPEGKTFRENTENLLLAQAEKISKTLVKEISDDRAHFEGEVTAGAATIMNVSYTYLTVENQSAGFTFAADIGKFEEVCRPVVDDVVKSVNLAPHVPAGG